MNCKICGSICAAFGSAVVLGKHRVAYYRCPTCGFVQTEEPHWLEEAYARPINLSDTGIIARNCHNARLVAAVLSLCFSTHGKYVDYGGGYGILVRMMRDRGFDFYRDEEFTENIFANGFDVADAGVQRFELLTAFEVFEHFVDPAGELPKLLKRSDNVLFSTEVLPEPAPQPAQWWYYGLNHGQHVSFYTRESLRRLADSHGLYYCSRGKFHLFSRVKGFALFLRFALAALQPVSWLIAGLSRKPTLREADCRRFTGRS